MPGHSMDASVASEDTAQADSDYSPYADSKSVRPAAGLFEKGNDVWEAREWPIRRRTSFRQRLPFVGSRVSFGALALFPLFARASAMKVCHDKNGRRILPGSLLAHSKLLDDLHNLSGRDNALHIRRTAAKLTHNALSRLIRHTHIFTTDACAIYLSALDELCDDAVPEALQQDGLHSLSNLVLGAANMGQKDLNSEIEDCRVAFETFRGSSQVTLRLAALWYIWLFTTNFGNHSYKLFDADSTREFSVSLADMTRPTYPSRVRQSALNLLWKFENLQPGLLSISDQRSVWMNIMELTRTRTSRDEAFLGFRYLWWYSLFPAWSRDFRLAIPHKRKVGLDLYQYSLTTNAVETRRLAYELIYLLANTELWRDMFDDHTCRAIVGEMVYFCRADASRINRPSILSQISNITIASSPHVPCETTLGPVVTDDHRIALRERVERDRPRSIAIQRRATYGSASGSEVFEVGSLWGKDESESGVDEIDPEEEMESMCSTSAIVNGPSTPRSLVTSLLSDNTTAGTTAGSLQPLPSPNPSVSTFSLSTRVPRHPPPADLRPEKAAYSTLVAGTNLRMGGNISTSLSPNPSTPPMRRHTFGPTPDAYALSEIFPQRLSDSRVFRTTLERCDVDTSVVPVSVGSEKGKGVETSLQAGTLAGMMENLDVFVLPGESLLDQKDARTIYSRLVEYIRYERSIAIRELAVQAIYVLSVLMSWTSSIRLPEGPIEVSSPLSTR